MVTQRRFEMLKENLKKILAGNKELGNYYDIEKNTAYFYIIGDKKLTDEQKKNVVEIVKDARIDTVIGEGEMLIIINRKGVIAQNKLVNAQNFVKNVIITGRLMQKYEEEESKKK